MSEKKCSKSESEVSGVVVAPVVEKWAPWEDVVNTSGNKIPGLRRYVAAGKRQGLIYLAVKIRGRTYTECTRTTKASAAQKFLEEKRREIENSPNESGTITPGQKLTMADCYKIWYDRRTTETIKQSTLRNDRTNWNGLLKNWSKIEELKAAKVGDLAACFPSEITRDHLLTFKGAFLNRLGMASNTFNPTLAILVDVFAAAIEARQLRENPAAKIPRAANSTEEKLIPADDELPKIADGLYLHRSKDFMWFLAYTGLRLNEANHVRKCDVHWERGQGGELWVSPSTTKGRIGKERGRWVPIFPQAKALIQKLCEEVEGPEGWLFRPGFNIKKGLEQACKEAGFRNYTHHAFRHYFATRLLQHYNVRDAAEILGHRDGGKLLLQTYAHFMPSNVAAKQGTVQFGPLPVPDAPPVTATSRRLEEVAKSAAQLSARERAALIAQLSV